MAWVLRQADTGKFYVGLVASGILWVEDYYKARVFGDWEDAEFYQKKICGPGTEIDEAWTDTKPKSRARRVLDVILDSIRNERRRKN